MKEQTNKEKSEAKNLLKNLINSCGEGHSGEWDCSNDQGLESFKAMQDDLLKLASMFDVDLSQSELKLIDY